MKTTCPTCTVEVSPRGLAAHRASLRCLAAANALRAASAGLVRVDARARGMPLVKRLLKPIPDGVLPGGPGRRAKLVSHPYAPAWLPVVLAAASTRPDGAAILAACVAAGEPVGAALEVLAGQA